MAQGRKKMNAHSFFFTLCHFTIPWHAIKQWNYLRYSDFFAKEFYNALETLKNQSIDFIAKVFKNDRNFMHEMACFPHFVLFSLFFEASAMV